MSPWKSPERAREREGEKDRKALENSFSGSTGMNLHLPEAISNPGRKARKATSLVAKRAQKVAEKGLLSQGRSSKESPVSPTFSKLFVTRITAARIERSTLDLSLSLSRHLAHSLIAELRFSGSHPRLPFTPRFGLFSSNFFSLSSSSSYVFVDFDVD